MYCHHLYFMKTGHEINCCVFKSRECICIMDFLLYHLKPHFYKYRFEGGGGGRFSNGDVSMMICSSELSMKIV